MSKTFAEFLRSLKPNSTPKIIAWVFTIKPILQYIFEAINALSNLDFAISARGNPRMISLWNFLLSPLGNICFSVVGFLWLTYFAWRQSNRIQPKEKYVQGFATVNNNPQAAEEIESLKRQRESEIEALNEELTYLKFQYADEIDGRRRAFLDLQSRYDALQKQNDGLNQYVTEHSWLHNIAAAQARDIDHYVTLERISLGDVFLNIEVPHIKFGLYVLNDSLFDVTVELAKKCCIVFRERELHYEVKIVSDGLINMQGGSERCLTIEQCLRPEEAQYIASSESIEDATFYFDRLAMTIKGGKYQTKEIRVQQKPLCIDKGITLHGKVLTFRR